MKVVKFIVVVIVLGSVFSCNKQSVTTKSLETELDSVSYAIGLDMALKLKGNFAEADSDLFIQGFQNGIDSLDMLIDTALLDEVIGNYFRNKQQRDAEEKAEVSFAEVKKEGEDFLATNKTNEGVITTESGLQFIVLKEGTGEKPSANSTVTVHYHGTSLEGTVFDSSVDRGTPITHSASGFVKGFNEGLALMNVGSKYRFFIPQELAYGANPRQGGPIKPFEALIFEVELLEIN